MKYTALHNVRHDGKLYKAEEPLELDDTTADTLLACGAVEAMAAAEKKSAKKRKSKAK